VPLPSLLPDVSRVGESTGDTPSAATTVIDGRVSTKEQTENLSLPTQLRACEEYCRRQGYDVVERFQEKGESAKTTDRSQLQALLKYCRTQLMDDVLAAFAQFDNDVRSERTLAGMTTALSLGRWTYQTPLGYLNTPKWSKSILVHDPVRGPLMKHAFGDLASGQFTAQEVIRRATDAGLRTRRDRPLSAQTFGNMLRNRIYIGHIESPEIAVSARGDFEPLIDEATFYRAQAVLDGRVPVATPRQRTLGAFRCAASSAAKRADARSRAVGRRGGTAATRSTTARTAAGPSTSARPHSKAPSWMNWHYCSRRLATCGSLRIKCCVFGSRSAPRPGTEPPNKNDGSRPSA
jgi:DNA invertase Pin-like site-specific DNA recombinase